MSSSYAITYLSIIYHISPDYARCYFATRIIDGGMAGEMLAHDHRAIASMAYGCNIEIRIICSITRGTFVELPHVRPDSDKAVIRRQCGAHKAAMQRRHFRLTASRAAVSRIVRHKLLTMVPKLATRGNVPRRLTTISTWAPGKRNRAMNSRMTHRG